LGFGVSKSTRSNAQFYGFGNQPAAKQFVVAVIGRLPEAILLKDKPFRE
jgi:hypothetical protein